MSLIFRKFSDRLIRRSAHAVIVAVSVLSAACDVSDDGDIAGIDGSGSPVAADNVSTGTIDGFGSVIVNGVRYDTSLADISVSGDAATEDNLGVGAYVTVVGSINQDGMSGFASTVDFQPNVIGDISAINANQNNFTVLGQTVRVNNDTTFGGGLAADGIDALSIGQRVRVSGPANSAGDIIASLVDIVSGSALEVTGEIANLNTSASTFTLASLTVNYAQAQLNGFSSGALQNGLEVIVEGSQITAGALIAESISVEENYFELIDELSEIEIEGFITEFESAAQFVLGNTTIITNNETEVSGGTLQTLDIDMYIEVEGMFDESNRLIAEEIEILTFADQVIAGRVSEIEISNEEDDIPTGTIVLQGNTIIANVETRYEDESEVDIERFNLLNISVGDYLSIAGEESDNGFVASTMTRFGEEDLEQIELEGVLITEGEVTTLFGYVLTFNEQTEYYASDEEVSGEMFFDLAEGALVEMEGRLEGEGIIVSAIEVIDNR